MAWDITMVTILRVLLNDMDSDNYSFTDERLQQVLVVAAQYVQQEIDFTADYTIDIASPDIDPDPTVTATKDDAFTNFVVLKAACIADQGLYRSKALLAGLKARCGPAILETTGHLVGFKELLTQGPCAAYEKLKFEYTIGNAQACRAILSPFVGNNFTTLGYGRDTSGNDRDDNLR